MQTRAIYLVETNICFEIPSRSRNYDNNITLKYTGTSCYLNHASINNKIPVNNQTP